MKKKLLIFMMFVVSIFSMSACGKASKLNLADYLIEERINLFTASDNLYSVTLSSGKRESNYNLDGIVNDKVDFSILTITRNDNSPLANDKYSYITTIDGNNYTGFLEKSEVDNSYSIDLGAYVNRDSKINVQISFTGYSFKQDLTNTSSEFSVDGTTAIGIANKELNDTVKEITSDKNVKIEVIMKVLRDYSNELKNYYWYVGVISTNGDTLGVLIDANSGDIIAKKV